MYHVSSQFKTFTYELQMKEKETTNMRGERQREFHPFPLSASSIEIGNKTILFASQAKCTQDENSSFHVIFLILVLPFKSFHFVHSCSNCISFFPFHSVVRR